MGWPISLCAWASAQKCFFFSFFSSARLSARIPLHQFIFLLVHLYAHMCICVSSVLCKLVRCSIFFSISIKAKKKNMFGSQSAVVATPGFHQDPDCQQAPPPPSIRLLAMNRVLVETRQSKRFGRSRDGSLGVELCALYRE